MSKITWYKAQGREYYLFSKHPRHVKCKPIFYWGTQFFRPRRESFKLAGPANKFINYSCLSDGGLVPLSTPQTRPVCRGASVWKCKLLSQKWRVGRIAGAKNNAKLSFSRSQVVIGCGERNRSTKLPTKTWCLLNHEAAITYPCREAVTECD